MSLKSFWTNHLQMTNWLEPIFYNWTGWWKGIPKGVDETHQYHNNHHSHISGHPTPQRAEVSTTSILDFSKLDKPHWQSELGFQIPLGWVNFLRSFSADSLDLFYHKRDTWIASWCHTIKTRVGWFWSSKVFYFFHIAGFVYFCYFYLTPQLLRSESGRSLLKLHTVVSIFKHFMWAL